MGYARLNLYIDAELNELVEQARKIQSEADSEFNISALVRPIIVAEAEKIIAAASRKKKRATKKRKLKRKPSSK